MLTDIGFGTGLLIIALNNLFMTLYELELLINFMI